MHKEDKHSIIDVSLVKSYMKRILQRLSTSSSGSMTSLEDDSAIFTCFRSAQNAQNPSFTPS